jgi:hypothetical protein
MDPNDHRRQVLRRLGRDWEEPEERAFVGDYLSGRVPTCQSCGIPFADRHCLGRTDLGACEYCYDRERRHDDSRWHSMVLVQEGPLPYAFWFWYPDPIFARDSTLQILWESFGPFRDTDRARDRLGGDWELTTERYFRGQQEPDPYYREDRRFLHLDRNDNSYLVLPSSPAAGTPVRGGGSAPPGSRWPGRPCTVLHAGHPRSRHPKRPVPKRHRKGLFRGPFFPRRPL